MAYQLLKDLVMTYYIINHPSVVSKHTNGHTQQVRV